MARPGHPRRPVVASALNRGMQRPSVRRLSTPWAKSRTGADFPVGRSVFRHELDGPHDYDLTMADSIPLASLYVMYDLHQTPSVLYGLLVTENTWGTIVIDALGYRQYFGP